MQQLISFISANDKLIFPIILFFVYIPSLYIMMLSTDKNISRKRFLSGIITIMGNTPRDQDCIPQIQLLHRKISEKFSTSNEYKSALSLLEEIMYCIDTFSDSKFKFLLGIRKPIESRNRLVTISHLLKQVQPYASLSSKQGNLLIMLLHSIESKNEVLTHSSLNQLAEEIEILETTNLKQQKKSEWSLRISVIGTILTIIFGIISLLPQKPV